MQLVRLHVLLVLSGLTTYLVELYSFTLAHSASGISAVLVCPGILVIVANLLTGPLRWAVAVLVNVAYYELVWRLVRRKRKA